MGIKIKKKKIVVKKPVPPGYVKKSTEPKEWTLTLHRGTNTKMGFAHEDNFARFGVQYTSDVKSFGWVYIPLARGRKIQTLEVRVIELADDE